MRGAYVPCNNVRAKVLRHVIGRLNGAEMSQVEAHTDAGIVPAVVRFQLRSTIQWFEDDDLR